MIVILPVPNIQYLLYLHLSTLYAHLTNISQVAGVTMDCVINTLFFIAGVIPGHIHGFYITCTYFHRKKKVKKGKWPGGPKPFIYSQEVWNGGASNARVRVLWEKKCAVEDEEERIKIEKVRRRRGSGWKI